MCSLKSKSTLHCASQTLSYIKIAIWNSIYLTDDNHVDVIMRDFM